MTENRKRGQPTRRPGGHTHTRPMRPFSSRLVTPRAPTKGPVR
jgi:hypothetical protein